MSDLPVLTTPTRRQRLVGVLRDKSQHYWKHLTWQEVSGSLGDLGTLVPILVSLSITHQVSLPASLVFGGLWNIITGLHFGIPMCVQPMKAIAAIALSKPLSSGEIMGAGISVGLIVFLLGVTRTIRLIAKYTPHAVIKGIQLGTGFVLAIKAVDMVKGHLHWGGADWRWYDNYELALVAFIFVFFWYHRSRSVLPPGSARTSYAGFQVPTALILFLVGLIFALVRVFTGAIEIPDSDDHSRLPSFGFYVPQFSAPAWSDITGGFLSAGLGQLPLTLLNSGIAVSALAVELFPEKPPHKLSVERITMSVGIMNVIGCLFHSMPYCHGSGGLAGQYRFGARTEVSILLLGLFKILLGFLLGTSLLSILQSFPQALLGVMLFISGTELALAARKYTTHTTAADIPGASSTGAPDIESLQLRDFVVMLATAGLILGYRNDAIGFLGGVAVFLLFQLNFWLTQYRLRPLSSVETDPDEVDSLPENHHHHASRPHSPLASLSEYRSSSIEEAGPHIPNESTPTLHSMMSKRRDT
ncbi:hypothetical protein H4R34_001751 [Dimargaris verticillata]|uniref:Sulfate transporter n=1 Tax=Dimargaris verticillata TaxID=2761393 RepID=A0A9W8EDI0_9FUNG|nr:hypothetical protein H4R34_001751 [Dimargaris verticillata]